MYAQGAQGLRPVATKVAQEYKAEYYQKNKEKIKQKRINKVLEKKRRFYYSCIAKNDETRENQLGVPEVRNKPICH